MWSLSISSSVVHSFHCVIATSFLYYYYSDVIECRMPFLLTYFYLTQQDCDDSNPLIRALAVRTMGCIRVDKITEYMCEPLRKCLKDEDPYVRKTAAVSVAKLYDINAQLVEDQGFLESLKELLSDSNPMVGRHGIACNWNHYEEFQFIQIILGFYLLIISQTVH